MTEACTEAMRCFLSIKDLFELLFDGFKGSIPVDFCFSLGYELSSVDLAPEKYVRLAGPLALFIAFGCHSNRVYS